MSHTLTFGNATFNFNSDLSGDVTITVQVSEKSSRAFDVSGDALVRFVAEYVRREHINRLEGASTDELLGLSWPRRK